MNDDDVCILIYLVKYYDDDDPEISDFEVNNNSYMAFSCRVWTRIANQTRPYAVALDDIIVYDQALPEAAVRAKYQSLLKSGAKDVKLLVLSFDGQERGIDKVPYLRCNVDTRAMSESVSSADFKLKQGNKVVKQGSLKLTNGQGSVLMSVPVSSL